MRRMTGHHVKRLFSVVIILILFDLVTGCQPSEWRTPIDRSVLTDDPCAAPCWQGITPGETTTSEAWDVLIDLAFIRHDHYPHQGKAGEEDAEWIYWRTLAADDPTDLSSLYVRNDIVALA